MTQNSPHPPTPPSPYAAAPPTYGAAVPTNSLAIIAFVLSMVGLLMFPLIASIAGLILGQNARKQIAVTGENGAGLATAAIVIAWVGLAIVALSLIGLILYFAFFVFVVAASAGA